LSAQRLGLAGLDRGVLVGVGLLLWLLLEVSGSFWLVVLRLLLGLLQWLLLGLLLGL